MQANQDLQKVKTSGNTALDLTEENSEVTVESRFGPITINISNAVYFPSGLLGMPNNVQFCLADLPKETLEQFKLLQSLEDESLSFVVFPIDFDNPLIEKQDLQQAAEALQLEEKDTTILLITTVNRTPEKVSLSVNVRAPLLIDVERKLGAQYVLSSEKYNVRHIIG